MFFEFENSGKKLSVRVSIRSKITTILFVKVHTLLQSMYNIFSTAAKNILHHYHWAKRLNRKLAPRNPGIMASISTSIWIMITWSTRSASRRHHANSKILFTCTLIQPNFPYICSYIIYQDSESRCTSVARDGLALLVYSLETTLPSLINAPGRGYFPLYFMSNLTVGSHK